MKLKMSTILKKFILIVMVLIRFQISSQLDFAQEEIKYKLLAATEDLDPKIKVHFADYLKTFIDAIPMLPKSIVRKINEVLDEFKSECSTNRAKKTGSNSQMPNLMDVEYIYGNTFANKVQQSLTEEQLHHFMISINEDEQSSKMSAARYLTIYLESKLKNVAEQFAHQFENEINQLTTNTISHINNHK